METLPLNEMIEKISAKRLPYEQCVVEIEEDHTFMKLDGKKEALELCSERNLHPVYVIGNQLAEVVDITLYGLPKEDVERSRSTILFRVKGNVHKMKILRNFNVEEEKKWIDNLIGYDLI
jgi:hypothetical protein